MEIVIHKKINVKNAILVVGFPGIGSVGKIAAEYFIAKSKAQKVADIFFEDFPPEVIIDQNGLTSLFKAELFLVKDKKTFLVLTGNSQPLSPNGMHTFCTEIMDFLEDKISQVITFAGYGVGVLVKEPKIHGAASNTKIKKDFEKLGIKFGLGVGSIIGLAGLFVGYSQKKGIDAVCLMGETHGQILQDPLAAKIVLKAFCDRFGLKLDFSDLEKNIKEFNEALTKIQEIQREASSKPPTFNYIR
ncbi:MAG: PAC2 family protein [archaeon]